MVYSYCILIVATILVVWFYGCIDTAIKQRDMMRMSVLELKPNPGETELEYFNRRINAMTAIVKVSLVKHIFYLFLFRDWKTLYE